MHLESFVQKAMNYDNPSGQRVFINTEEDVEDEKISDIEDEKISDIEDEKISDIEEEDSENEDGDEDEDKCPYQWIEQLFQYERSEYDDVYRHWKFYNCTLNQYVEPFNSDTPIDIISVDFNTGTMTLNPCYSECDKDDGEEKIPYVHSLICSSHLVNDESMDHGGEGGEDF